VAVVACGRKLIEVIWAMLTRGERYRATSSAGHQERKLARLSKQLADDRALVQAVQDDSANLVPANLELLRNLVRKSDVDARGRPQLLNVS